MVRQPKSTSKPNVRKQSHPNCVVCSSENASGLQLTFDTLEDGSVQASFDCDEKYVGYDGMLHGGVISSLLDGAMTNYLFAQGRTGFTGELIVRFRQPVAIGRTASIRAWSTRFFPPFHALAAELTQDGEVKARARAKFMEPTPSR